MGILSRLFGDPADRQRDAKFREFERPGGDPDDELMARFEKATWLISRGNAMGNARKFDAAIRDFNEAMTIYPEHVGSYLGLALCYREQRQLPEALEVLERAPRSMTVILHDKPFSTELGIYPIIATVYMLMGDREKTVEYAKRAIAVGDDPVRREMEELAVRCGAIPPGPGGEAMVQLMHQMVKDFS